MSIKPYRKIVTALWCVETKAIRDFLFCARDFSGARNWGAVNLYQQKVQLTVCFSIIVVATVTLLSQHD